MHRNYYNIHDKLSISSNFSKGLTFLKYFSSEDEKRSDVDIEYRIHSHEYLEKVLRNTANVTKIAHGLYHFRDEDLIISVTNILGIPVFWGLGNVSKHMVVILSTTQQALTKSPILRNFIPGVTSLDHYVPLTLQIKLLQKKLMFVLASFLKSKLTGDAFMISSWPGMGKTEISLKLIRSYAFQYMSDDLTMVDRNGYAYAFPHPTILRKGLIYRRQIDPIETSRNVMPITNKSKVRNLYFLEYASRQTITQLDIDAAVRRLLVMIRGTLSYHSERTIVAYEYVNNEFEMEHFMEVQKEVLYGFLGNVKNCFLLKCPDQKSAIELIRKAE